MSSKNNAIVSSHRDAATRVFTYLNVQHGIKLPPIVTLEIVALVLGAANWQTLKAQAEQGRAPRMADVAGAGIAPQAISSKATGESLFARTYLQRPPGAQGVESPLEVIRESLFVRWFERKQLQVGSCDAALERVEQALGLSLAPVQSEAVRAVFQYPLCAISGESGTGKATILRALTALADELDIEPVYQARSKYMPTGADLAKLQQCGLLILKEDVIAEMPLLQFLLEQAPVTCRIVFFGDMPGVAPKEQHDTIREFIERGVIHAVRLVQKFRQRAIDVFADKDVL